MKYTYSILLGLAIFFLCQACRDAEPPAPFGATPSERQLDWHELEYYAFVHFNINTFSDLEWGHGMESPEIFNPTELDCRQWAKVCKEAGMKGIIITAKHHDGFCLWDSKYTEHDVASSPWRNGQGDLLKELSEACEEYGLKMGVYLSPWDRNNPIYGAAEYNEYFKKQLEEVLTQYDDIAEVWFDGAVSEEFKGRQIYDWDGFIATVRQHQPNAVIFSDSGPDIRWVGTEQGFANPTNWSTLNREDYYPGTPRYLELRSGNKNGTHWVPAEVDVSIRPGWYYHPNQDDEVKSPAHLELIYYNSVGRNANLLLNLPVDRRGLVHENDVKALMELRKRLDETFVEDLASGSRVVATNGRGGKFSAGKVTDGKDDTYWSAKDGVIQASLELDLGQKKTFNVVELKEYIPLGQRIEKVSLDAWADGQWERIAEATTVGYKRWIRIPKTSTSKIRINIEKSLACPTLSKIGLYHRPHENYLLEPEKSFDKRMSWWRNAGFGMFIHWGVYAIPAGIFKGREVSGIGEWIMYSAKIPIPEYEQFVKQFNPVQFDAEQWVGIAKDAGMKYIVITSKHHDGFCLWDSKVSTYDIMDAAPFGRDILKELFEACKKEGIKLCFYHSIMDWHHPDAKGEGFSNYRENYLKPQLRELAENYKPAVLWFDGEWIDDWDEAQGKDLYNFVRSLKTDIIINNRVGKGRKGMQGMNKGREFVGDFGTPEQEVLDRGSETSDWESCMTMNDTWGFKKNDHNWKSAKTLIHNLVDIAAKGGNYLLNVGPTAEGLIPQPSVARLNEMGEWMKINGEAVYHTRMWNKYKEGENIRYTFNPEESYVYAISLEWPEGLLQLKYIEPEKDSDIHLLGYPQALQWNFDLQNGLNISIPEEFQEERNRPCRYAWVFKIKGSFPRVAEIPQFHSAKKDNIVKDIFSNETTISLGTKTEEANIYYTLNGATPTTQSMLYREAINLQKSTRLKAIAVKEGFLISPVAIAQFQKSTYNGIQLKHPYAPQYDGGGHLGLLDELQGSANHQDGRWQGFEENDFEAIIDLGETKAVNNIKATFLQDLGAWIFPPKKVEFAISNDGENYRTLISFKMKTPKEQEGPIIHPLEQSFSGLQGRYIKVFAQNVGICPQWHAGAGGKAWLFIDEVVIE